MMLPKSTTAAAAVVLATLLSSGAAWAPAPQLTGRHSVRSPSSATSAAPTSSTRLYSDLEKQLRQEIAQRNALVPDEEQYAVADGEGLERLEEITSTVAAVTAESVEPVVEATKTTTATKATATKATTATNVLPVDKNSLQAKIDRLTKPRAYPLFLAEKAAEFVEATVFDFTKAFATPATNDKSSSRSTSSSSNAASVTKERVVILGTGWGAASFLKDIDTSVYDVTVVSPRNYFLFTPMLAGASVGTVEYRSICEPVREINRQANFLEGTAREIHPAAGRVTCESVVCDGNSCQIEEFVVEYDRLIVTVGAQTNTFGIPGVREHCCFLRQVEDARRVRTAIVNCFERANLPSLTDEERVQNLTFAVIGAGPTGIEFAAELRE